MTLFDIPVGYASVFMVILIGYFVLTVWFGKPPAPVVQRTAAPQPQPQPHAEEKVAAIPAAAPASELNAG